ncbi:hypothetical protein LADH09A_002894 [Micromonospora sp. LAH09]|uniref:hypothetical protein n=1 Tax=Micromonospora cabrerizensis TaxID=2911213 RepID=UPI001EE841D1|nr:hypothetical protein [Micromonospora cabrerizensis]MCG5468993.1 hypothetical protein [Micromonospora cabrerizensis]
MTATSTLAPAPARPTPSSTDGRRQALLALARFEAFRMLRHPLTIAAALLFLGPWLWGWLSGSANRYPVLSDELIVIQLLALPILGGSALIVANLVTLRAHRHKVDASYDVLVLPPAWRLGGFLLALLSLAGVSLLLVGVRVGVSALLPGAVGSVDVATLVTPAALVLLLGAVGVFCGVLIRSVLVAPLAVLLVLVLELVATMPSIIGTGWRFLLPVYASEFPVPVPASVSDRPAARHLAYLVGLTVLLVAAVLARAAARRSFVAAALSVGLILAVGGGLTQSWPDPGMAAARATVEDRPASIQSCVTRADVTYCFFDGFGGFVSGWDEVVTSVRAVVPDSAASSGPPLAVRQRVPLEEISAYQTGSIAEAVRTVAAWKTADAAAGTPEAVRVGTEWGDARASAVLAAGVAYRLMAGEAFDGGFSLCGARAALLVWLVGQASPTTLAGMRSLDETSMGALSFSDVSTLFGISAPDRAAAPALALLKRPSAEVPPLVERHWAELTARDTPLERFGAIFGVPVQPLSPEEGEGLCTT